MTKLSTDVKQYSSFNMTRIDYGPSSLIVDVVSNKDLLVIALATGYIRRMNPKHRDPFEVRLDYHHCRENGCITSIEENLLKPNLIDWLCLGIQFIQVDKNSSLLSTFNFLQPIDRWTFSFSHLLYSNYSLLISPSAETFIANGVDKVFLDPTAEHLLLCAKNDVYYLNRAWSKAQNLPKLHDIRITSVAWDLDNIEKKKTGFVLLGTEQGDIYEWSLEFKESRSQRIDLTEKCTKRLGFSPSRLEKSSSSANHHASHGLLHSTPPPNSSLSISNYSHSSSYYPHSYSLFSSLASTQFASNIEVSTDKHHSTKIPIHLQDYDEGSNKTLRYQQETETIKGLCWLRRYGNRGFLQTTVNSINNSSSALSGLSANSSHIQDSSNQVEKCLIVATSTRLWQWPSLTAFDQLGRSESICEFQDFPQTLTHNSLQVFFGNGDKRQIDGISSLAWLTGAGIFLTELNLSQIHPVPLFDHPQHVPFPVNDTQESKQGVNSQASNSINALTNQTIDQPRLPALQPMSFILTPHHYLILYNIGTIEVISRLTHTIVQTHVISEIAQHYHSQSSMKNTLSNSIKMVYNASQQLAFVHFEKTLVHIDLSHESQHLWFLYLQKQQFDKSISLCQTLWQRELVTEQQAQHYFSNGQYNLAAHLYGLSSQIPFESIATQFIQLENPAPLRTFVMTRLQSLGNPLSAHNHIQRTALATWLVELYLQSLDQLEYEVQREYQRNAIHSQTSETLSRSVEPLISNTSILPSNDQAIIYNNIEVSQKRQSSLSFLAAPFTSTHFKISHHDLALHPKYSQLSEELQAFFRDYQKDLNTQTTLSLLLSHSRTPELVFYANLIRDHSIIITHYIQHEEYMEALAELSSCKKPTLFYKYCPVLMMKVPKQCVDVLISLPKDFLDPILLIPALSRTKFIEPLRKNIQPVNKLIKNKKQCLLENNQVNRQGKDGMYLKANELDSCGDFGKMNLTHHKILPKVQIPAINRQHLPVSQETPQNTNDEDMNKITLRRDQPLDATDPVNETHIRQITQLDSNTPVSSSSMNNNMECNPNLDEFKVKSVMDNTPLDSTFQTLSSSLPSIAKISHSLKSELDHCLSVSSTASSPSKHIQLFGHGLNLPLIGNNNSTPSNINLANHSSLDPLSKQKPAENTPHFPFFQVQKDYVSSNDPSLGVSPASWSKGDDEVKTKAGKFGGITMYPHYQRLPTSDHVEHQSITSPVYISLASSHIFDSHEPLTLHQKYLIHSIRYLEHCIFFHRRNDSALHYLLLSLYVWADLQDTQILSYLKSSNIHYEYGLALRICTSAKQVNCCIWLYGQMGAYAEAVDLALEFNRIDLAQSVVNVVVNPARQRQLWLRIAQHLVEHEQDLAPVMLFLKQCPGLKIEHILPFFPDFVLIDDFKAEICRSLHEHSDGIQMLQQEMKKTMQSAQRLKSKLENAQKCKITVSSRQTCDYCHDLVIKPRPTSQTTTSPLWSHFIAHEKPTQPPTLEHQALSSVPNNLMPSSATTPSDQDSPKHQSLRHTRQIRIVTNKTLASTGIASHFSSKPLHGQSCQSLSTGSSPSFLLFPCSHCFHISCLFLHLSSWCLDPLKSNQINQWWQDQTRMASGEGRPSSLFTNHSSSQPNVPRSNYTENIDMMAAEITRKKPLSSYPSITNSPSASQVLDEWTSKIAAGTSVASSLSTMLVKTSTSSLSSLRSAAQNFTLPQFSINLPFFEQESSLSLHGEKSTKPFESSVTGSSNKTSSSTATLSTSSNTSNYTNTVNQASNSVPINAQVSANTSNHPKGLLGKVSTKSKFPSEHHLSHASATSTQPLPESSTPNPSSLHSSASLKMMNTSNQYQPNHETREPSYPSQTDLFDECPLCGEHLIKLINHPLLDEKDAESWMF